MTVIMIIATTTVENTTEKLVYFREMEGSTEAQLAAQSATEQAILAMKDFNAGYSVELQSDAFEVDEDGDGVYETWADYTVYSTAQTNDTDGTDPYYYTPIPGTGSAASEDDCTVSDSDHDGDFDDDEDVDHPCNWNKLLYGESVTIPLYADDGSGGISNPSALGFNGFYLKVRTPCADTPGEPDEADCSDRFTMDENDSTGTFDSGGDSVIFWQLIGESDSDGDGVGDTTVSVLPDDEDEQYGFGNAYTRRNSTANTEIYEGYINDAYSADYIVLEAASSSSAPYDNIYGTCTDTSLTDLSLQLDIVTPLTDDTGASIPYLEWQLAIDSTDPFGDTKAVVVGEGYHQGQSGIFYYPFVVTRSTTGESTSVYTLSN